MEFVYWKTLRAETMTPQQILDYFRWSNHTACNIYNYFGGVEVGDMTLLTQRGSTVNTLSVLIKQ